MAAVDQGLRERAREIGWYHTIELAPDLVTEGMFDNRPYVDRYGLPADLSGKRALDVGTFDGFWAFELERRGAQVVAIDVDDTRDYDWPPRYRPAGQAERRGESFALARELLGSSAERISTTIYDATPEKLGGTFDLVFVGVVLIHVRDPMLALERLAALCHGQMVMAEEYSRRLGWLPFVKAAEFRAHAPHMTWWRPTIRTWQTMIEVAGFEDVRRHGRFDMPFRADSGRKVPHVVFHARGPAAER
jgi:tRNA (mo5U34)-methyltransferase